MEALRHCYICGFKDEGLWDILFRWLMTFAVRTFTQQHSAAYSLSCRLKTRKPSHEKFDVSAFAFMAPEMQPRDGRWHTEHLVGLGVQKGKGHPAVFRHDQRKLTLLVH